MPRLHTSRDYEEELRHVRERLLYMGGRVEKMIVDAVRALSARDVDLAERTIRADRDVDASELEIDERCLQLLARRQPMASDLRFIVRTLKMVTDLERIGDLAANICVRVIRLERMPALPAETRIADMARVVRSMVSDSIDAFVREDCALAREVVERDADVDELYHSIYRDALQVVLTNPEQTQETIVLQSVVKCLERMADHATNLAEQVVFVVEGRDIRHRGLRE